MKYRRLMHQVTDWLEAARPLWKKPDQMGLLIEEWSPWLSRQWLTYLPQLTAPHELGMGMTITSCTDNQVEILLPAKWKNQSQERQIHHGAIITAAEHCFKILWGRHLDPGTARHWRPLWPLM